MSHVVVSLSDVGKAPRTIPTSHQYWNAANHTEQKNGQQNYLRAENWKPDILEHLLPVRSVVVNIPSSAATAMLRYVEELKMYANLADVGRPSSDGISMHDPDWLDNQHERILEEWQTSKIRSVWLRDLLNLATSLDQHIHTMDDGAFVKLSVRSPKDSAQYVKEYRRLLKDGVCNSNVRVGSALELSDTVDIVKYAAWKAMRVRTGAEALSLLLRSERIYLDMLQAELFSQNQHQLDDDNGNDKDNQRLKIHVSK